jgi:predicted transcriptional regulator
LVIDKVSFQQKSVELMNVFEIKKRSLLQIVAEILESLTGTPIRKTHISFKCNLDSRTISKYIEMMEFTYLIEKSPKNDSYYQITQKGIDYLNQFRSFIELLDDDKVKLMQYNNQIN